MTTVDPRDSCTGDLNGPGYEASGHRGRVQCCADALADGAIVMRDLCPPCRRFLIEATDAYAGYRLPWPREAARADR